MKSFLCTFLLKVQSICFGAASPPFVAGNQTWDDERNLVIKKNLVHFERSMGVMKNNNRIFVLNLGSFNFMLLILTKRKIHRNSVEPAEFFLSLFRTYHFHLGNSSASFRFAPTEW